jgi:hypothetical protein
MFHILDDNSGKIRPRQLVQPGANSGTTHLLGKVLSLLANLADKRVTKSPFVHGERR